MTSIEVANFLLLYLQPKNQKEVSVTTLLSKYPLKVLQQDVLQLLEQKKARFQLSVLDQVEIHELLGLARSGEMN